MQVVAITVFFLLTVAYYAFFAPFLGNKLYEYIAIGVYSFLVRPKTKHCYTKLSVALNLFFISHLSSLWQFIHRVCIMILQAFSVLVLYIRCTGIDPADPGIFVKADNTPAHKSQNSNYVPGTFSTR